MQRFNSVSPAVCSYLQGMIQRRSGPVCSYLYDLSALRQQALRCMRALPTGCQLFYAIKANPDPQLLRCLLPIVDGFEAASAGEIEVIREVSAEVPVLFGGPGKKDSEIETALELGVSLINVESLHELRRVSLLAQQRQQQQPILLRVNLHHCFPDATVTMAGRATQFGIDESLVPEAIALAQECPGVALQGFHMHSISNNLDASLQVGVVATYLQRVRQWVKEFDLGIRYLDAGGGLGVSYDGSGTHFDIDTFTVGVGKLIADQPLPDLTLLLEPGRLLVAHCGYYAAEVIDLKCNHGKQFAVLRGGSHHLRLPVSWQHNQPFQIVPVAQWDYPFPRPQLEGCQITLVGELCTPKDVLARDVNIDRLRVGDIVLFTGAGAYGWTISHHDFLSHPYPQHHYIDSADVAEEVA